LRLGRGLLRRLLLACARYGAVLSAAQVLVQGNRLIRLAELRMATSQRLALALAVSAGAHFAVLASAPLAPGLGAAALFAGRPLTARLVSAPETLLPPAELPVWQPQVAPASVSAA